MDTSWVDFKMDVIFSCLLSVYKFRVVIRFYFIQHSPSSRIFIWNAGAGGLSYIFIKELRGTLHKMEPCIIFKGMFLALHADEVGFLIGIQEGLIEIL
jgi:hypothetical protein